MEFLFRLKIMCQTVYKISKWFKLKLITMALTWNKSWDGDLQKEDLLKSLSCYTTR